MIEVAPAVALLFDDTELGGQLRDALHERGARIVHEGGVSSLSRELLQQVGAEVVVVNLDDAADDALDQLYEAIDGDRPRVVFNDAQASRALTGWDRARWARHLAVKVLAVGDVDPPRPLDARDIELPAVAEAAPDEADIDNAAIEGAAMEAPETDAQIAYVTAVGSAFDDAASLEPDLPVHDDADGQREQQASNESESLAAELEALLASTELPSDEDDESGPGLRYANDEELPPLYDGNFGAVPATADELSAAHDLSDSVDPSDADEAFFMEPSTFELDQLHASPLADVSTATVSIAAASPDVAGSAAPVSVSAPDSWALLDDDALMATPDHSGAPAFGVEKLSAADFLAPDVEQVAHDVEPTMSLELISMEEAVAPKAYVHDSEMLLDDLGTALSRIVLLGAAVNGTESVCDFLSALPVTTRLTFLHTQHVGEQDVAVLLQKLAGHCALPVRMAERGTRAAPGEVLVVPVGQQVRLRRDGNIELEANSAEAVQDPSIDASFTMAANVFGRDAVAIVFAGRATDAVAGAQAIHDRGGRVWVESSSGEHYADMVSGIFAERLVSFSGTPQELAAHLLEVFP